MITNLKDAQTLSRLQQNQREVYTRFLSPTGVQSPKLAASVQNQ